jgi:transposase InsO family protein
VASQSLSIGVSRAARNNGISRRTVYRWRRRPDELSDRSCRPRRSPRRTTDQLEAALLGLRLELRWGPDRLGPYLGVPASTAYAVLRRWNAARLRTLFPVPRPARGHFGPVAPGYIALDVKSLGRLDRGGGPRGPAYSVKGHPLVGYRHLHVAIDLASRLVYAELRAGLGTADGLAFLSNAIAFFDARGIRVQRVLTDNGAGYRSSFTAGAARAGVRHTRTKPRHPWTNGRVEAFNGTIQRECLYAAHFTDEEERGLAVALFVAYYNAERPHTALGGLSPERWLRAHGVTHVHGDCI